MSRGRVHRARCAAARRGVRLWQRYRLAGPCARRPLRGPLRRRRSAGARGARGWARGGVLQQSRVDGVTFIMRHRSPFAFVVPLNDGFEGGGTQFVELDGAPIFRPAVGAALLFSGKNRHRGVETTEGVRYILAGFVDVRKGFVDKRKRSRSRSPPPESSPQSRKRARGAAASPEPSRNQGPAAFDACARAARPVLQQLAGMPDDRARLAQALLDAIPE